MRGRGVPATNADKRRRVEAELRSRYGGLVYKATVPLSVKVEEATSRGRTIYDHAPRSAPALAYEAMVTEVIGDGDRAAKRGGGKAGGSARTAGAS